MKAKIIVYVILFLFTAPFVDAQTTYTNTPSSSVYDGTWKWEGQNRLLCVYISTRKIISQEENNATMVLRVDYQMENSAGDVLYDTKVGTPRVFDGVGAMPDFPEGHPNKAYGWILDFGN